jgi:hypothetical protein
MALLRKTRKTCRACHPIRVKCSSIWEMALVILHITTQMKYQGHCCVACRLLKKEISISLNNAIHTSLCLGEFDKEGRLKEVALVQTENEDMERLASWVDNNQTLPPMKPALLPVAKDTNHSPTTTGHTVIILRGRVYQLAGCTFDDSDIFHCLYEARHIKGQLPASFLRQLKVCTTLCVARFYCRLPKGQHCCFNVSMYRLSCLNVAFVCGNINYSVISHHHVMHAEREAGIAYT